MREALGSYNWETMGDGKAKGCLQGNKRGKSPGTTTDTVEGSNSDNRMMEVLMWRLTRKGEEKGEWT